MKSAWKLKITYPNKTYGTTVIYPAPVFIDQVRREMSANFPKAIVEVI